MTERQCAWGCLVFFLSLFLNCWSWMNVVSLHTAGDWISFPSTANKRCSVIVSSTTVRCSWTSAMAFPCWFVLTGTERHDYQLKVGTKACIIFVTLGRALFLPRGTNTRNFVWPALRVAWILILINLSLTPPIDWTDLVLVFAICQDPNLHVSHCLFLSTTHPHNTQVSTESWTWKLPLYC